MAIYSACITALLTIGHIYVVIATTAPCDDLDTNACVLLQKSQPNLCSQPALADLACKRFCGHCPVTCYHCPTPVVDYRSCTATMACPPAQTCMINTRHTVNGRTEYTMACANHTYCSGSAFGFLIGGPPVGRRELESRNLNLRCCNTDLCNRPDVTTAAPPHTPRPTNPLPVHSCNSDIVFVVDESGSIGVHAFNDAIMFVKQVVTSLDIGPHSDQVGLLVYDYEPRLQWNLNEYITKAELLNALGYVPYHDGGTRTDLALKYVREHMLAFSSGDRVSATNVVVVVTDGRSNIHPNTLHEARQIHKASSDVIAVGVGHTLDQELIDIATDQNHAMKVATYADLGQAVSRVLTLVCRHVIG